MKKFQGRPIRGGQARGPAMVARTPINFTAAFTKPANLLPSYRSQVRDRHHELFKKYIRGSILIFPAAIGSTYTGMVLMELMFRGHAPAAMVVGRADPLLVSGSVLAEVWFGKGTPVVEYGAPDIFDKIRDGEHLRVDGNTGLIEKI